MVTEKEILERLKKVKFPGTECDLVSSGSVKDIHTDGDRVTFSLEMAAPAGAERDRAKEEARKAVLSIPGVKTVSIAVLSKSPSVERSATQAHAHDHERALAVKYVVPVASGKGGVGKSTVSANLAVALSKLGFRVGLMDADVYGPSIPTIMGIHEPPMQEGGKIVPHIRYDVKLISMGFFLPKGEAVIWRGPMLHKMIDQFLGTVDWGELDFLIVDLPPGTGDIQLSLCQKIPLTGAVIVSTPQDLAFQVAEKAIFMFKKLRTPVLGLIENMSGYVCRNCGSHEEIFGEGGALRYARKNEIGFLGQIPLSKDLRVSCDEGKPIVEQSPNSPSAKAFMDIARKLSGELESQKGGNVLDEGSTPKKVTQPEKNTIHIIWSDDHESRYAAYDLRKACPCAMCVDENTGKRILREESIPKDIELNSMDRVGRYGITFRWSDGHSTGIYTFERLRSLCTCSLCEGSSGFKTGEQHEIAR